MAKAIPSPELSLANGESRGRVDNMGCAMRMGFAQSSDGMTVAVTCNRTTDLGVGTALVVLAAGGR